MMRFTILKITAVIILSLLLSACGGTSQFTEKDDPGKLPGNYGEYTLLPNGWRLTPAGTQTGIGQLPMNVITTKDEKYIITSNSGFSYHSLSVIDTDSGKETGRFMIDKTWRGICLNEEETQLYASGGENNLIYIFDFNRGNLTLKDSVLLGNRGSKAKISPTGISWFKGKGYLLVVTKESNSLYVINAKTKEVLKQTKLPAEAFEVIVHPEGKSIFVSVWGGSRLVEIDPESFEIVKEIPVGDHPCEMLFNKAGTILYVANANNNTVSAIDYETRSVLLNLNSSIAPDAPYGSTPNSIALSPDDEILYIANADNNFLTLFDVGNLKAARSIGFIPTGWYPTGVRVLSNGKIYVTNGKGSGSFPNSKGADQPEENESQYIASIINSTLSVIPVPESRHEITRYSLRVAENTPVSNPHKSESTGQTVIPSKHENIKSSRIKYVFYVVKENRTYDQVFGDISQGNGDSSICIFGEKVTPNQHQFTKDFVLFDNFYVDAEVSADGHNWSMAAYASDFTEKTWPTYYGGRGGNYDYEGGRKLAAPSSGYIWNRVLASGLRYRNYGEYVKEDRLEGKKIYVPRDDYLLKHTCTSYPGFDMGISDVTRYEEWEKDFSQLEAENEVPNLSIIRMGNDHTVGTRKGSLTPRAYVAQNDYAVGKLVERISNSSIWKESIIFILEDDAQNGSDHVDAHRSIMMMISPYVKRNYIDHSLYTTSSVLKTIELILGLSPMTQYDLAARPLLGMITAKADLTPYKCIPPVWDINEKNIAGAYGSERCEELNLAVEDAIPDIEFNEIIWKSIKGSQSVMPPPVRSAFVNYVETGEEDDED